ncbi:MAG: hypothetical protein RR495_06995 [Anaerovoracaceae bacterium]
MNVNVDLNRVSVDGDEISKYRIEAEEAIDKLWQDDGNGKSWVKLPMSTSDDEIEELIMTAIACQDSCGLFVVIGNGGSFLGTKAVIEAIDEHIATAPEILFLGDNISTTKYSKAIEKMRHYDVNVCVVSKSGETPETLMGYEIIKDAMFARYGDDLAPKRIMVMTGEQDSTLRELANKDGCGVFTVPSGFVGNYSILSPASLFPMAVAGIDIKRFIRGAEVMATDPCWDIDAAYYAIARKLLFESGKAVEVFSYDNPNLESFALWLVHLFSESEGKNGQGLFTATMSLSRDFKAMGQFMRGHRPNFFETEILAEELITDMNIPEGIKGKIKATTLNDLNAVLAKKMKDSYKVGKMDNIRITIPAMNEFNLGQLVYFMLTSAAVSAQLFGVDPFDRTLIDEFKENLKEDL